MLSRNWDKNTGKYILHLTLILSTIGIIMIFDSSTVMTSKKGLGFFYFLKLSSLRVIVGIFLMWIVSKIDYKLISKYATPILLLAIFLLLTVKLIGFRWINLYFFSFQPSEFGKFALIVFLAYRLSKVGDCAGEFFYNFLPLIAICSSVILLVALQPSFGVAFAKLFTCFFILLVGRVKLLHLITTVAVSCVGLVLMLLFSTYARQRLNSFINPDPNSDLVYQIGQSLIAIGSGKFIGRGLGQSGVKFGYLPEPHTDFIFSIIGEEFGFLGSIAVIGLFILLIYLIIKVAIGANSRFGFYLAFGIAAHFFVHIIFNLYVITRLMPTTGIPLPLISYGGTALVLNFVYVGILLNIAKQSRKEYEDGVARSLSC